MNPHASRWVVFATLVVCILAGAAQAQDKDAAPADPNAVPVAVLVNDEPIYVAELEASFVAMNRRQRVEPAQAVRVRAELLEQLVNRRLVVQALERDAKLVEPREIKEHMEKTRQDILKQNQMSLEEYARRRGVGLDSLRKELYWRLGWERYLDRHLADALEEHFKKHKKDLDGTEVRASHILLRRDRFNETDAQIMARAKKIRDEIESGKASFEEAAQKYSVGPSGSQGGDLGFFPRKGVMVEEFAKAAFALDKGQLSQPLTTVFGTHLIRVTDLKPGSRQWTEVIPQIKTMASAELFDQLAKEERQKAKVAFTGKAPYFKPDTRELVVPAGPQQAATK
ncbi:MAG: peptidylprolyl isomerase [Pirellulales bacterium]